MDFPLISVLQGIAIGIVVSLPLGPVALITMKRTAEFGHRAGIISGLAIALIDTVAMIIILLSVHQSLPTLRQLPHSLHVLGAVVVFGYGLRMFLMSKTVTVEETLPWHKHFISSILIALSNPSTYVSFGLIGLMMARYIDKPLFTKIEVTIGFFIGAFLWWSALAFFAITHKTQYFGTTYLKRLVGALIMLLAVITFISVL
jgi:threonine/homoserine/homoserine lactone efflux protein